MALNVRILNICGQMPILRRLGIDKYMRMGTAANRKRQIAFSQQQLATRLGSNPNNRHDIVYYLQKARDPDTGEGYSQQELISEVTLLLGAGASCPCASYIYCASYISFVLSFSPWLALIAPPPLHK
jgi:hypothetical protein